MLIRVNKEAKAAEDRYAALAKAVDKTKGADAAQVYAVMAYTIKSLTAQRDEHWQNAAQQQARAQKAEASAKKEHTRAEGLAFKLEAAEATLERGEALRAELENLLDCVLTYAPEYMHGEPTEHHVRLARKALTAVKGE
jgi:hypothetical protein